MRLRQVALVAHDLDIVVPDLCAVLGVEVCFHDPAVEVFGLRNALMPIGDTFLEVVCPIRADATAARYLARRGGDGGYMVIVQSDDLERDRKRVAELGIRTVFDLDLEDIAGSHLHPKDTGGAILSLDQPRPPASWRYAGPEWESKVQTDVTREILGAEIQSEDPKALAERWSRILDREIAEAEGGKREIALDRGVIRFVPATDGRGEGLSGLMVKAAEPRSVIEKGRLRGLPTRDSQVMIGGTWITFV